MEHTSVWPDICRERGRHCVEGEMYLEAGTKPMWLFLVQRCQESQVQGDILFFAANCTFVGSTTLHYLSLEVSNSAYLRKSTMSTCIGSGTLGGNKACAQGRQHCISSTQQASGWQPLPINRLQSSHLLHEPGLCRQQHWQRWFLPLRRKAISERGNKVEVKPVSPLGAALRGQ